MATFLVVLKSNAGLLLVKREEWSEFLRDYEIAPDIMRRYMPPGRAWRPSMRAAGCPTTSSDHRRQRGRLARQRAGQSLVAATSKANARAERRSAAMPALVHEAEHARCKDAVEAPCRVTDQ